MKQATFNVLLQAAEKTEVGLGHMLHLASTVGKSPGLSKDRGGSCSYAIFTLLQLVKDYGRRISL